MRARIWRDQAVWERETFEVEVPDGLTGEALQEALQAAADNHAGGADHVECLGEVSGMDVQTAARLDNGQEVTL